MFPFILFCSSALSTFSVLTFLYSAQYTIHLTTLLRRGMTHPPLQSPVVPFSVGWVSACSSSSTPAWAETDALGPCTCWPIELWSMHLNRESVHDSTKLLNKTSHRMCLQHYHVYLASWGQVAGRVGQQGTQPHSGWHCYKKGQWKHICYSVWNCMKYCSVWIWLLQHEVFGTISVRGHLLWHYQLLDELSSIPVPPNCMHIKTKSRTQEIVL